MFISVTSFSHCWHVESIIHTVMWMGAQASLVICDLVTHLLWDNAIKNQHFTL